MAYLIIAALVFALCYGVDKGFSKLFRNRKEHHSGLAVKLNKRYILFGTLLAVLGIAGLLAGEGGGIALRLGSVAVLLMAAGLIIYYLSFGIYYDADHFLVCAFGRKELRCDYGSIREQKRYVIQGGSVIVELHMDDGTVVSVQSIMEGAYPFLDYAYARWCEQKGLNPENCEFHNPSLHCWFPEEDA